MALVLRQPLDHWSILIEERQTSSLECYTAIEEAIRRREIPGVKTCRVRFKEGGSLSAERLYLRVSRKRLGFDICAAPFGTGFFFSWRRGELPASNYLGCFASLLLCWAMAYFLDLLREIRRAAEMPLVFPEILVLRIVVLFLALWVVGKAVRKGYLLSEDAILNMPLIGAVYDFIFCPPTYYKLDTIEMYKEAVHSAVLEVVNEVRDQRGLRALAPDYNDFLKKGFDIKPCSQATAAIVEAARRRRGSAQPCPGGHLRLQAPHAAPRCPSATTVSAMASRAKGQGQPLPQGEGRISLMRAGEISLRQRQPPGRAAGATNGST